MSLDPLALATLGVGFHPTVSARLGLWAVPVTQQVRVKKGKGNVTGRRLGDEEDELSILDDDEVVEILRVFLHLRSL